MQNKPLKMNILYFEIEYFQLHIIAKGDHHPREINGAAFAKMTPFVLLFVKMSTALFCYRILSVIPNLELCDFCKH